jgi:hypothetical protein
MKFKGIFNKSKNSIATKEPENLTTPVNKTNVRTNPVGDKTSNAIKPTAEPEKPQKEKDKIESEKPQIKDPVGAVLKDKMDIVDAIAPESVSIDFDYLKINNVYLRSLFVSGYPRFVSPGWLEQIILRGRPCLMIFCVKSQKWKPKSQPILRGEKS